jgi:hypothetical protein
MHNIKMYYVICNVIHIIQSITYRYIWIKQISNSVIFFSLLCLGFELRALHL